MKASLFLIFLVGIITTLGECNNSSTSTSKDDLKIQLKWVKSYQTEDQTKVEIGLKWILSYLGAHTPKDAISWVDNKEQLVLLELDKAGFSTKSMKVWAQLIPKLKKLDNYTSDQYMDIGKFILLTFNNSWSYYALTDMPVSLENFKSNHDFDDQIDFVVKKGESCVSKGYRQFNIAVADSMDQIAYISHEGHGDSLEEFEVEEFEVFDFMDNGQPRFAIYDLKGQLLHASPPSLGKAGKPASCMWCHTSNVAKLHFVETGHDNFLPAKQFKQLITEQNRTLKRAIKRKSADPFIVDSIKNHSYAELLYRNYEYPSFYRLRNEGYNSELELLKDSTHTDDEYKFFNLIFDSVIHRKKIDPNFNLTSRSYNKDEVNYLNE